MVDGAGLRRWVAHRVWPYRVGSRLCGTTSATDVIGPGGGPALSKDEPADAITDIHMISEHAVPGQSFAYVSYKANGESKYAAILASARGVTNMGTFWLNKLNVTPLQAVELSDGPYILIAGGVFNHPPMRTVVLTFPNGRAVDVPVSHGRFWYFARPRAPKAEKFFKHMIGVSTSGDIIQNPPSHSS